MRADVGRRGVPGARVWRSLAASLLPVLLASLPPAGSTATEGLPEGFALSKDVWEGIGGPDEGVCEGLDHYPVVLVHDDGEGPERWLEGDGDGLLGHLRDAGLGPCGVWALRIGERGQPLRSLEELTDDVRFFLFDVLRHTGAQRIQFVGVGSGALLIHATLAKYHLHELVHAAVYVDGPFAGDSRCNGDRCLSGDVRCCALRPGANFVDRALRPHEAPKAFQGIPDRGSRGHLSYLCLGSTPPVELDERGADRGGWMLDGASNVWMPAIAEPGWSTTPAVVDLLTRFLSDPAPPCAGKADGDGDGFCDRRQGGTDCDDRDARIHPGAEEVPDDGVDQDCNRHDLVPSMVGWRCEQPLEALRQGAGRPPGEGGPGGPPPDGGHPPPGEEGRPLPLGAERPSPIEGVDRRTLTLLICLVSGLVAGVVAWLWPRFRGGGDEPPTEEGAG